MSTILGTKLTANGPGIDSFSNVTGNQRATVLGAYVAPEAGYITHLGAWLRDVGDTNPYVYLAVYALDPDGTPAQLLGRTARIAVHSPTGSIYQFAIVASDPDLKGAQTSIRMQAGQPFTIAIKVDSGEVQAYSSSTSQLPSFRKTVAGTGSPTDPFLPTAVLSGIAPSFYAIFESNRAPTATLTSPADNAALGTTTPTFVGTFTDLDSAAPRGDRMSAYALEVVRVSDNFTMWGGSGAVFVVSAAERSSGTFSRVYAGAPLVGDGVTQYEWRARVFDDSSVSSPWSTARRFTINAAGFVSLDGTVTPPTKVDTSSATIDWQGRWFHPSSLAMNAAQVRINVGGIVLKTGSLVTMSPTIASSASPGTFFTVDDLLAGIGTLAPGLYTYQIQGRATDGQFSPWSDPKEFRVNAPPTTPSNLQPPSGSSVTDQPLLEWNVVDPDPDDVYGVDVDSEILLTRPNGSSVTIITTNYDLASGKGYHQTTTAEVLDALRGRYSWKVRGRDSSAGSLGIGQWSSTSFFDFVEGPVVAISSPIDGAVVTTSTPTIAWAVTEGTQTRFRIRLYEEDNPNAFASSTEISGTQTTFVIPQGWLKNGGSYDVTVTVWDGDNDSGTSFRRHFTVSYTEPLGLSNLEASLYQNRFDPILFGAAEPSSVLISWIPSALSPGEFSNYMVRRRIQGQDISESIVIARITNPGQARWIDHLAPPNIPLIYTISQFRRVSSVEILESGQAEIEITLPRSVPILCSAINPGGLRFPVMWLDENLGGDFERASSIIQTWGAKGLRTNLRQPASYGARKVKFGVTIRTDERGEMYEHLDMVDDIIESGDVLCWAPERPRERMFCALEGGTPWSRNGSFRERSFSAVEVNWTEGIPE